MAAIVAFVEAHPGATANEVAAAVPARRAVVLGLLKVARAGGVLAAVPGQRKSQAWFVARGRSDWYPWREEGS
jgi:hypothetical protein